jgi:hypothetical protein
MITKHGTHSSESDFKFSYINYINTVLPTHQLHINIHLKHIIYPISHIHTQSNSFVWVTWHRCCHPSDVTPISLIHNYKFYQIRTLVNNYS